MIARIKENARVIYLKNRDPTNPEIWSWGEVFHEFSGHEVTILSEYDRDGRKMVLVDAAPFIMNDIAGIKVGALGIEADLIEKSEQ